MTRSTLLACVPLLLVAACGRTEPVSDLPTQEELAAAANAAAASAIANQQEGEKAGDRNYVNAARGFAVTLPEGWVRKRDGNGPDMVAYEDPGAGADIRVAWDANDGGKTLQQIVATSMSGSEGVDGDFIGDNEYRGTANDGEGNNVALRLLRQPDGGVVTASFVYPEMLSEQYQGIAEKLLDSVRLFAAEEQADGGKDAVAR